MKKPPLLIKLSVALLFTNTDILRSVLMIGLMILSSIAIQCCPTDITVSGNSASPLKILLQFLRD